MTFTEIIPNLTILIVSRGARVTVTCTYVGEQLDRVYVHVNIRIFKSIVWESGHSTNLNQYNDPSLFPVRVYLSLYS
mgnify:CR=1 FL=1